MKLDSLEPAFKEIVLKVIEETEKATGLDWIVTSCRRTIKEQNDLYKQGRTTKGSIITNAKGGQSPHNFGLAVDCVPMKGTDCWWNAPEGFWETYGAIAESHGLMWGGHFKSILDRPHIEQKNWKETQKLWQEGKIEVQ